MPQGSYQSRLLAVAAALLLSAGGCNSQTGVTGGSGGSVAGGAGGKGLGGEAGSGGSGGSGSGGEAGSGGSGSGGKAGSGGSGGTGGLASGSNGSGGRGGAAGSGGSGSGGASGRGGAAGSGGSSSGGASGTAGSGGSASGGSGGPGGAGGSKSGTGGGTVGGSGSGGVSGSGGAATGGTGGAGGTDSAACDFTVTSQLASDISAKSPTTVGIVKWSVTGMTPTSANIELGLDATYGTKAPVDLTVAGYQTPLLGMKPSTTYHFRIVASSGSSSCTSQDQTIQTGDKATSVSIGSYTIKDASAHQRGFIITSYWNGSGKSVPFILDADGNIAWWYGGGPSNGIARARISADSKNMWMVVPDLSGGGHVQRVSMDTLDGQTYASTQSSHDIAAVSGSTMAYIDYSPSSACNGNGGGIVEIDPSGKTKTVVNASTFLSSSGGGGMGCHGNSLRYSAKEDYYTYSDVQSDVYILNRSGALQWKLSSKVGGNSSWGGVQHGQQLLDNSIIIFANSGGGSNASAAIEYGLDGSLIKKFASGGHTQNLGDVQRLPGGNTLINYGNGGNIQEVDSSGNVVMEIKGSSGSSFGYSEWRDSLYGPPLDINE
jgi:hypothetical protein